MCIFMTDFITMVTSFTMATWNLLLIFLIIPAVFANPVEQVQQTDSTTCSTRCPDSSTYQYSAGSTYKYRYEAETRTTMGGAAEDTATITISATANLAVLGPCDMALTLNEVVVKRSHEDNPTRMVFADDMSRARRALENHALRFAFFDGELGDVCPDENEDLWALNVKKGLLTAFQNSMKQLDREEHVLEADVTGRCPTHYQVTQTGWKSLSLKKTKDMLSCTERHDLHSSLQTTPYSSPNSVQSLPLLKSSHECQLEVDRQEGVLRTSACQELHVFRPFSKAASGARTETTQSLTYLSKAASGRQTSLGAVTRRTTLLFEHKQGADRRRSALQDVKNTLKNLCDVTKNDIRPQVPQVFGDLVHQMRHLDYSDLKDLSRQLDRKVLCPNNADKTRTFFLDALPMAASGAALQVMTDLLTSGEVKDTRATLWLTALAFFPNPDPNVIGALKPLLTDNKTRDDSLLAVSSLVNNYCQHNPLCADVTEVQDVISHVTNVIGKDCRVTDSNLKQVLLALRALGNIGVSEANSLLLQRCFGNNDHPMDVRVAAVDAYRRMPCSAERNEVMELFRRESEDTELRIAAYLAVIKCPTPWVIDQVRQTLLAEKVNQVGSFVWTHLTNLLETASPHKQAIRDVLENEVLQKEFNMDRRKFSRNYELSFFSDKFNLGGTYESNLIWSAGSFVPRSAMVNLTVDVFGQSVNLLEVGGRVQGLESLLFNLFGPSSSQDGNNGGYGNSDIVSPQKLTNSKSKLGQVKDELRGQVYVRVLGNELAYRMVDGSDVSKLKEKKGNTFFDDFAQRLMKDGQVSTTYSTNFIHSTLVIPTAVGLPLNLTVNGSLSVELEASQRMDLKKINSNNKAFEIEAVLQPSGAVELASMMTVDAYVSKVGLKMTSVMHSSTAVKGRVELARGQIFSVQIDVPRDTMEIFSVQSKFYITHDTYEKEQKMVTANRQEKRVCSGNELGNVLGMSLCAEWSFPNASQAPAAPYFPFTGPSSLAITLTKQDVHTGYRLLAKQLETSSSVISQLALDTPGSKVDRSVSLGFVANIKTKTLEADLLSPWKKVSAKVALENSRRLYKTEGSVVVDGERNYTLLAVVEKSLKDGKEVSVKLKPRLLVTGPTGVLLSLLGDLDYGEGKHLRTNAVVEMKDVLEKPVSFNYDLKLRGKEKDRTRFKNSFKLSSQFVSMTAVVSGAYNEGKRPSLMVSSKIDYNLHLFPTVRRNLVDVRFKYSDRSSNSNSRYDLNLNVDAKRTPEYNLVVDGQMRRHKQTKTEVKVTIRHGQDVKVKADKDRELTLSGSVDHNIEERKAKVEFDLKAVYPLKKWEYELQGKHEHDDKSLEDYLTARYAKGKSVDIHLLLAQKNEKKRHATFDLSYPAGDDYPARDVKINADFIEQSPTHHVVSALVSLQKGEKNSVVVSFQRPKPQSMELSSELNLYDRQPITLDLAGNWALRHMQGEGRVKYEGQRYEVRYTSDIVLSRFANFTLDVTHPERRVTARLEGGQFDQDGVKRVKTLVQWDADRNASQRAGFTVELAHAVGKRDINVGGLAELFLPVESYQHLKGHLQFEKSARRILTIAETVLGQDDMTYSAKFQVKQPVTQDSLSTVLWLKSPHPPLRHLEAGVNHSFDAAGGQLSTSVRGVFNQHFLEAGLSGGSNGNLVVRLLEGLLFLRSSIPGAENWRLSFNHRDSNNRYNSQALLHANGDQYSADLDGGFSKVHYQIQTDGTATIRAPQLSSPVVLVWVHRNSLHDLASKLDLEIARDMKVTLEVEANANIISHEYKALGKLRGPWRNNGQQHTTQLQVLHSMTPESRYDTTVTLKLESDTYEVHNLIQISDSQCSLKTNLDMSRYPRYNFSFQYSTLRKSFPYTTSLDLQLAGKPLMNLDVDVEKERDDQYRSHSRLVLYLDDAEETVTAQATHAKNRDGEWVSKGSIQAEAGKVITFDNVLDFERGNRKSVMLTVVTPYDDINSLHLNYTHFGDLQSSFVSYASIAVSPHFNAVSSSLSWSNRNQFRAGLLIDTPFRQLPHLEIKVQSQERGGMRHSTVSADVAPGETYKADMAYRLDLPRGMDVTVNLSTPLPQLPMLQTQMAYTYTDDEVTGLLKLVGPATDFQQFSTNFGHRRSVKQLSSHYDAVLGDSRRWSGRADVSWQNEIDGTLTVETSGQEPWQLVLSHRGHSWHDFRTKTGFKMNGDRLESELAYSDTDGRSGLFMLATPDPDIDFFKTTFFQRHSNVSFEGRYAVQYGEKSKPYELGLTTSYSDDKIAFATDLRTPHSDDLNIDLAFAAASKRVDVKLLALYGPDNKIDTHVKYVIKPDMWDVGAEFEYLIKGSGRDIGLTFTRDGPTDNLQCKARGKYMGKRVSLDMQLSQGSKVAGRVDVITNLPELTDLSAIWEHSGDDENFQTGVIVKYQTNQEARANLNVSRNKWKRLQVEATLDLPIAEYSHNKLTYKHVTRKNKVSADAVAVIGDGGVISGEAEFADNSKLTVSITGPYKDFQSCGITGTWNEADMILQGQATVSLFSQPEAVRATYTARAGSFPVVVSVQAVTPYEGWSDVQLSATHAGNSSDFSTSLSFTAKAIGTANSDLMFTYTSPTVFDGRWTMKSGIKGAQDLRVAAKSSQNRPDHYHQRLLVGWDLLKEIVLDTSLQIGDDQTPDTKYKTSVELTTPWSQAKQVSMSVDHRHNDRSVLETATASYNGKTYLDADFVYTSEERRVGHLQFRQPRPMEFLLGGRYTARAMEGEIKVNWDKREAEMNVHLTADYSDLSDATGDDKNIKTWVVHPARTMGLEYVRKKAAKESQTDFLFTWDKALGQTLSYVVHWADRSSRYTTTYDGKVKVGVPMRSVQLEGVYSDTGRAQAAEGAILWDADRDSNMKVGVKGKLDQRGQTNKLQLGLDLPFIDKEYSLSTEIAADSGSALLDARTEFSYSVDPRKLVVLTTRIHDLSFGSDATNYTLTFGFVHPATDINVNVTSHVGSSHVLCSMATRLEYLTARRERKTLQMRSLYNRAGRNMMLELQTPIKAVSLEGQMVAEGGKYNVRVTSQEDGRLSQVTDVFVNPDAKTLEMSFRYDKESPSKSVNVRGQLVTDRLLQAELYRLDNGQRVSETLMTVRLNTSHVVHTRLNWNTNMLTDLKTYLGTQLTIFSYGSSEALQAAAQVIGQEVEAKYNVITKEIRDETGPLLQQLQVEMQQLQKQMDATHRDIRRFYNSNTLHVQDLGELAAAAMEDIIKGLQGVSWQYRQAYSDLQKQLAAVAQSWGQYPMAQKYATLIHQLASGLKNSRQTLEAALNELIIQVSELSDKSYHKYLQISRQIERKLQGYISALRSNTQLQKLASMYSNAQATLSQLSSGQYQQLADAANLEMLVALDRMGLKDLYVNLVTKSKQLVTDQFHDLMQRPEYQQIYIVATEIYQQTVWAYQYWHVEQNMQLAVHHLIELAKDVTLLEITRIKNAIVDLDKSRIIVFDPQNGEMQFEVYLPVSMKSLSEAPDMRVSKYVNRIRAWAVTYIPTPQHSLWAYITTYLPSPNADTWVPPFTGYAYVLGDQHVVTFDGRHYDFAGRCSYVLARDMLEDRFTVVIDFSNRPRSPEVQTILVLLRGVAIEIDRSNKVKVNGQGTELPYRSGVISAVRDGSVIRVQDSSAITVEMDNSRAIHSVSVSGWYHGRIAGLLGTYDNEPYNDLMDAEGGVTQDTEALGSSWEVGRRFCRSRNLATAAEMVDAQHDDVMACQQHLNQTSSYYAPCFHKVDADAMVAVCVEYSRLGSSVEEAQCKAGQQYSYMCRHAGLGLTAPPACVTCQIAENVTVRAGLGVEVANVTKSASADVVVVVEDSKCNDWARRFLGSLVTQLAQTLAAQGVTANRFGLLSYQGNGSEEVQLAHTIEGEFFGQSGSFLKATEALRLADGNGGSSVSAALQAAMQYPYRVGVARLLVLLPCSLCGHDVTMMTQVLQRQGFVLHVLSNQRFNLSEGNDHLGKVRIFGLDSWSAHTEKSAARQSAAIFQQVRQPGDACSQLALATNGSLFDISHMSVRGRVQNEFLQSFAARAATNVVSPSCQSCRCLDDGTGRGQAYCTLCDDNAWLLDHIPYWLQRSSVTGTLNHLHYQLLESLKDSSLTLDNTVNDGLGVVAAA